jgi:hypothetical protein
MGVAGEHLVAQGKAVEGHHQGDADLLAVGTVIAAVAASRQRIALRLAFEVGAGHVVQQHFVVDREQLAAAPRQMCLQLRLVLQQQIERAIQPILVDQIAIELQQIAQRRAPIPILGNVQLARRLAQPGRHQHCRHLRPRHGLLATRQKLLAQIGKPAAAPQRLRQIDVAELAGAFHAHALQPHRHRQMLLAVVEQARLLGRADQTPRQCLCLQPTPRIELAKLRYRLLDDPTTNPHTAHKTPVTMDFAVLLPRRVAQVHALITTQHRSKENGDGRHYTPIRAEPTHQPLDLPQLASSKKLKPTLQLRKLG